MLFLKKNHYFSLKIVIFQRKGVILDIKLSFLRKWTELLNGLVNFQNLKIHREAIKRGMKF